MRIFKTNSNVTLFFAASLVTALTVPRLVDGKEIIVEDKDLNQGSSSTVGTCPPYGCPLLPRDMHFDEEAQKALKAIRMIHSPSAHYDGGSQKDIDLDSKKALELLKNVGDKDQATLTLIGYKGGNLQDQINQDRAFVISPYFVNETNDTGSFNRKESVKRLMGVFDGHAKLGELVSEYSVNTLPKLLSTKLEKILAGSDAEYAQGDIRQALVETFIELDKTAPAEQSGGCTASVVLQLGKHVYVANAGDSRSLVATYNKSTSDVKIVFVTREDKPDLPDERRRVESMGGQVYIPPPERIQMGASSRVLYVDPQTGGTSGLAMSRSIGDWAAGKKGVIPDPTVSVIDIEELVKGAEECSSLATVADDNGGLLVQSESSCRDLDIEVFAVSATDGLLDFMKLDDIAKTVAISLYEDDGPHPLSACESLITTAASAWWQAKNGRYRDDIAIAISKLSLQ